MRLKLKCFLATNSQKQLLKQEEINQCLFPVIVRQNNLSMLMMGIKSIGRNKCQNLAGKLASSICFPIVVNFQLGYIYKLSFGTSRKGRFKFNWNAFLWRKVNSEVSSQLGIILWQFLLRNPNQFKPCSVQLIIFHLVSCSRFLPVFHAWPHFETMRLRTEVKVSVLRWYSTLLWEENGPLVWHLVWRHPFSSQGRIGLYLWVQTNIFHFIESHSTEIQFSQNFPHWLEHLISVLKTFDYY